MGQRERYQKASSLFSIRKGPQALALIGLVSFVFLSSRCSTTPERGALQRPANFPKLKTEKLTEVGVNKKPEISRDGKTLVWVAGQQSEHEHFQAYKMNMQTKDKKRVTYQDGEVFEIHMNSLGNRLYYSSTTDEIKEDSDYIRRALHPELYADKEKESKVFKVLPRTEIYRSSLDGFDIDRLTNNLGFDGMLDLHPDTNEMFYTSWSDDKPKIYVLDVVNPSKPKLKITSGHSPEVSPDGKTLAWLEKTAENTVVWTEKQNKKAEPLFSSKSEITDILWSPDGNEIWYSKQEESALENIEIYRFVLSSQCHQRITYHQAKDLNPSLSSDGQYLYFQSDRSGDSHIFQMDLKSLPTCASTPRKLE